jgi:flagellar FliL protein
MKKKLMIALPVLLIVLGGVYKFVLAKPAKGPKPRVDGQVYILPKDFLVNLQDGKYAKLDVALIFKSGYSATKAAEEASKAAGDKEAATPPDGYGTLPQEAVVRAIVTDEVTSATARDLTTRKGRDRLRTDILKRIHRQTDVEADDVLLTDIAVQ